MVNKDFYSMKHREFGWTKNIHMFNGTLVVGKPDTVYRPISQSTFLVLHHGLLSKYAYKVCHIINMTHISVQYTVHVCTV